MGSLPSLAAESHVFSDIADSQYAGVIEQLYTKRIAQSDVNNSFFPERLLTKAEATPLLE